MVTDIFIIFAGFIPFMLVFGVVFFIFLSAANAKKKRERLKPVQFLSYNRSEFNRIFEFACEACGQNISNREETCPYCGASYHDNPVYKEKKKAINLEYLDYLESQKSKIEQETDYIERTMKTLRSNIVMKRTYYNFDLGEKITYHPSFSYEFTCGFCGTKITGRSDDGKLCPNCGAGYADNLDLKVQEKEDQLDKLHYDEYVRLKHIEENQNKVNERKDAWTTKHARGIALLVLFGFFGGMGLLAFLFLGLMSSLGM